MWNFARTQTSNSHRSESIETPADRDLNKLFGRIFEPLEPPTVKRDQTPVVPEAVENGAEAAAA